MDDKIDDIDWYLVHDMAHSEFTRGIDDRAYYWVSYSEKLQTPFNINEPLAFLSARAIERRNKQGIPVTEHDLPVNPAYITGTLAHEGVSVVYTSRWFNGALIRMPATREMADRLLQEPFISEIRLVKPVPAKQAPAIQAPEVNKEYLELKPVGSSGHMSMTGTMTNSLEELISIHASAYAAPVNDLYAGSGTAGFVDGTFPAAYGESATHLDQVGARLLHENGFMGEGLHIAVLDAGFSAANLVAGFREMRDGGRLLGTRDFVNPVSDIYQTHPHGTYVLSVMAARSPGILWGAAADASYWLIRTEDAATEYLIEEYNWLAGAEFADSAGVDIINSSLGYSRFDDASMNHTYADMDGQTTVTARAANMAYERGMLVVASAGNYGNTDWYYIGTPADAPGTLTVGAVDNQRMRVSFSSAGPTPDGRIKPDIMAMGRRVPVPGPEENILYAGGTSFSSPIIAGMAACLWQKFPGLSVSELKDMIIKSADRIDQPDSLYGYGIPNFTLANNILEPKMASVAPALFPNPVRPNSSLTFYLEAGQLINLDMINLKGQTVFNVSNIQTTTGFNRILPFRELPIITDGVYVIRLYGEGYSAAIKCFVLSDQ